MIKDYAKCELTHRDLATIASKIFVDYSKLEFQENLNSSSEPESINSIKAWDDLSLLYDVISQFINDRPLPF